MENLCNQPMNTNPQSLAAAPPSTFSIHHAVAFLTQALITKTGESPSAVNRAVRAKLFNPLILLDKDFPGQMERITQEIDLLPRNKGLAWYLAQARIIIQQRRHELTVAQEPAEALKALTTGIGNG